MPPGPDSTTSPAVRADTRAAAWFAFAALCLAGAGVGALSLVLPHPETARIPLLWANTSVAAIAGLLAFVLGRRGAPLWLTQPFMAGGTLLIANAAYLSGDGTSYYTVWFVWIVLHVYSFYGRRTAAVHLAWVAGVYAVVLALLDAPTPVARWVTTMTTLVIAAVFVDRLVRSLRLRAEAVEALMVQLEAATQTDELTGLANRRGWERELTRAVKHARRFGLPLAVALLDLDQFKRLNDEGGHAAGDDLLREAAAAWSSVLREVDTLARWGGDEFGLIITGCDAAEAAEAVERVRSTTPAGATCSAGLVVWDGHEDEASLMARADAALYAAKRAGRDRLVVADDPAPVAVG